MKIRKLIEIIAGIAKKEIVLIEDKYLRKLEYDVQKLKSDNDRMMMTFYSASAARKIMEEIREIINCPPGYDIIEAIKKLKENKK